MATSQTDEDGAMADATAPPSVAAVVLNWNNYEDTARCVASLLELSYDSLNVVVVDNGSTDGSGERLREEFDDVTVLFTEENVGFGAGMNVGIRHGLDEGADHVWVVNNDSVYEDDGVLACLVETVESDSDVGIVSPQINCYPDTESVWFERGNVDPRSLNADHNDRRSLLDLRFGRPDVEAYANGPLVENDYIPLCSALIRRDVLETVGLLPEEFFLYYEDVAYARQVADAGYRLVTRRDVTSYHLDGGSTDGELTSAYYTERNRILYARRTGAAGVTFAALTVWRLSLMAAYSLATGDWGVVLALAAAARDGVVGVDGRGPYP